MIETGPVGEAFRQVDAHVRFDWGEQAARHLSEESGCLVVVDVLSFTTSVTIATGRGMTILPYRFGAEGAQAFARSHQAELAVGRSQVSPEHPWSLSPVALAQAPVAERLVLPSPNGSAIAAAASGAVVAACLRNASAAAMAVIEDGFGQNGAPVVVIAAGERWPDGSLRPALEDALGAGAVLQYLAEAGCRLSPEALVAAKAYVATDDVADVVRSSASGRELQHRGFGKDVEAAVELERDQHVAILSDGAFTPR